MKVEYSKNNKNLSKPILEKVSTKGLRGIGATIFGFAAPFGMVLLIVGRGGKPFEYDNSNSRTLAEQYEAEKDVDVPPEFEEILNSFVTYEKAADDFEAIQGLDGIDPKIELETRKNLVSASDVLVDGSKEIIKEKIREALGLSNSAVIEIKSSFNSADGINHVILVTDGNESYTIDGSKLPNEYRKQLDRLYEESRYQGNGTGPNWENQISAYAEELDGIYYGSLAISSDETPNIRK